MSTNLLFYGSLRDPDILTWVAGSNILTQHVGTVTMPGWQAYYVQGELYPILLPMKNAATAVDLYANIPEVCWERIRSYEGDEYELCQWSYQQLEFHYFAPVHVQSASSKVWRLEEFQKRHKEEFLQALSAWGVPRYP